MVTDWDAGDVVCGECGWVLHQRCEDPGRDWRGTNDSAGQTVERATEIRGTDYLLDDDIGIIADFRGTKMKQVGGSGISKRDRRVGQAKKEVANIARHLPGELPQSIQDVALEFYIKLWEVSGRKLRCAPAIIASCVRSICFMRHIPYVDLDFHKALQHDVEKPKAMLDAAAKNIHALIEMDKQAGKNTQQIYTFLRDVGVEGVGDLFGQYVPLCTRWAGTLKVPHATGILAAAVGKVLREKTHLKKQPAMGLLYSGALHIACHRQGASAAEEQVTASRIAEHSGESSRSIDEYVQLFLRRKDLIIKEASGTLTPAVRRALGMED
eukprot:TRINITY_DN31200_c0_g1_i1.p1 TRINITY_DN31200_c0_g1~~TRINITY_DN31200_c0_g1_i1.p1  ORF type:complete len:362 (+),score=111.15 TRINITY_DN31200_c0_g1_i1:112-1086(+)